MCASRMRWGSICRSCSGRASRSMRCTRCARVERARPRGVRMVNEETGRELDMAVAETLFGYVYTTTPPDVNGAHGGTPILVPFAGFLYKFPSALPPRGRVDTAYLVPH